MEKFGYYVPEAHGTTKRDLVEEFVNIIPYGEENAINRKVLTQLCVANGIIDKDAKDKDRAMRALMHKAKVDYAICNLGAGYFRPLPKDVYSLGVCIKKERSRAVSIFSSLATLEKVYEDIKAGRLHE